MERGFGLTGIASLPYLAICALLTCAMITDLRNFTIPHWISGTVLALLPLAWLCSSPCPSMESSLQAFGLVTLGVGAIWISGTFFGGGDWKLLSALAPWIGVEGLLNFFLNVSVVGGVETFLILLLRAAAPKLGLKRFAALGPVLAHKAIPYGIAIAIGAVLSLIQEMPSQ